MSEYLYFILIGLIAKIEKGISDHTEFLNYKKEMDKWLTKANEILDECAGIGDENETRQKLLAITVLALEINLFQKCLLYFIFLNFRICQAVYPKANNY